VKNVDGGGGRNLAMGFGPGGTKRPGLRCSTRGVWPEWGGPVCWWPWALPPGHLYGLAGWHPPWPRNSFLEAATTASVPGLDGAGGVSAAKPGGRPSRPHREGR